MQIKKMTLAGLFCLLAFCAGLDAQEICGFWKSINEKTNKVQCIVAVYKYHNKCYGRIVATFDKHGKLQDSIYAPKERAPGVIGRPYYCGLDFIWGLKDSGERHQGKILDPEKGNIYNAKLWVEKGNLIVRGELLFFGRNVIWLPASESDFPPDFEKPDVEQFVPAIPKVK